jgi:general nucleoside transport system ATP-binding protein
MNIYPAAQLRRLSKSFFGSPANAEIDLDLFTGEVHALLGENGAGKSTLCSILAGLYRPDSGQVIVKGVTCTFHSPRDALAAGIGMVYQHFRLVRRFTVAENLALGHPDVPWRLSRKRIEKEASELSERFGLRIDPSAPVWTLSVGEQQRVEILKLLHRGVDVLILDEPTAVLTPQESGALFTTISAIKNEGKAVVFVSHKLREVQAVADRITVLRGGRRVAQLDGKQASPQDLARLMMGGEVPPLRPANRKASGSLILELNDVVVRGDRGNVAVDRATLHVARSEIVGIAGVAGNGQRELAEAIAGLRQVESGTITLGAREITTASPRKRIDEGISFVPEDRRGMGMAAGLPLDENFILKSYRRSPFCRGPFLASGEIRTWSASLVERFDIRGARPGMRVSLMSGGNLQRAILARELTPQPIVLIAATPTRGLDVAATRAVWSLLEQQREAGGAILLFSEDLEELQLLADRTLVLYDGTIVGELPAARFDIDELGLMMAGHVEPPKAVG